MNQAQITRLMTFAQHGQPKNYAASDMMRSDLEAVLVQATELPTEVARLREGWEAAIRVNESLQSQLEELPTEVARLREGWEAAIRVNESSQSQLAAPTVQEPVAYQNTNTKQLETAGAFSAPYNWGDKTKWRPLYVAPTVQEPKGVHKVHTPEPVNQMLLEALRIAREDIDHWAGYASDYFRNKHNLAADLADIDAAIDAAMKQGGDV